MRLTEVQRATRTLNKQSQSRPHNAHAQQLRMHTLTKQYQQNSSRQADGYRRRSNRHRKHQTTATKGVSRTSPGQGSKLSKQNDANKALMSDTGARVDTMVLQNENSGWKKTGNLGEQLKRSYTMIKVLASGVYHQNVVNLTASLPNTHHHQHAKHERAPQKRIHESRQTFCCIRTPSGTSKT